TYTYNNRDMLVTEALSTGKTTTYAYNNSGNRTSKTVTQNSQNTVTSYTYDAYGNEDNASATDTNPFRYSGEYYDAETGFIYLRARYYDPSIGRFTAEDPIRDGTNWYVYCNNNPVMYVDPWGLAPTKEEAAAMADHIYNWEKDSDKSDRTIAGWRLIDVWRGRESMKMGFYINDNDDWRNPSEYAIVFRGSIVEMNLETIDVWKNNAEQFFSAKSADMWDAINYSTGFASSHSQEITFVGHSKGGAEALAAAVATGRNAMVFNPAKPNLSDYNLSTNNYTGNAMSYVVRNEALNNLFGEPGIGKVKYLDQQYKTPWYLIGRVRKVADVVNSIRNHMMDAVLSGI
ncbi:MAG: RHS repeat-associated core domain-containing protein, partial [Oscillospiraceae bacterium]|nr:RHS repeat-associated core domain-containing protein [Oscillospiraceae bacterium]